MGFRFSPWRRGVEKHTGPLSNEIYNAVKRVGAAIPKEFRGAFVREILPLHLASSPSPEQFETAWRTINTHFAPICLQSVAPHYSQHSFYHEMLPAFFGAYKTPEELNNALRAVASVLIPARDRRYLPRFLAYELPRVLRHSPSPVVLESLGGLAAKMDLDGQEAFFHGALLDYLEKKPPVEHVLQQVKIAGSYLNNREFFYTRVIAENFGRLAPPTQRISRLKFFKRGVPQSRIIPLGGKLFGNIIRIIPQRAYEAWLAAHRAGVPVEEILDKNGKPRAYMSGGTVRVYTRYSGQRVDEFLEKHPEHGKDINGQIDSIKRQLDDLGIVYSDNPSHFHEGNFTVEMRGERPFVRIIDFDMAYLKRRS